MGRVRGLCGIFKKRWFLLIIGWGLLVGILGCIQLPVTDKSSATPHANHLEEEAIAGDGEPATEAAGRPEVYQQPLAHEETGRPILYSLVHRTRGAALILVGTVMEQQTDRIVIAVKQVIKGTFNAPAIEVMTQERAENSELPPTNQQIGDELLLFTNPRDGGYERFAGSQGSVKLEPGWTEQYVQSIQKILAFDAAQAPETRTTILQEMLSMTSRLGPLSALEIIYVEFHTGAFLTDPLLPSLLNLSNASDTPIAVNAIQVLSRIGNKAIVPDLIQKVGSENSFVAETAHQVLNGLTGANIKLNEPQLSRNRTDAVAQWQAWWEANKDTVILRK